MRWGGQGSTGTNDLLSSNATLFSSQRCLTPINISIKDTNIPNTQPTINTKKTPPKLLISKGTAPLSDAPALDLKIWLLFFYFLNISYCSDFFIVDVVVVVITAKRKLFYPLRLEQKKMTFKWTKFPDLPHMLLRHASPSTISFSFWPGRLVPVAPALPDSGCRDKANLIFSFKDKGRETSKTNNIINDFDGVAAFWAWLLHERAL